MSRRMIGTSLPVAPSAVPPSTSGSPPVLARIVDGLHRDVLAHDQDVGVVGEARRRAEPVELARIELRVAVAAEHAHQRHVAGEMRDRGAVARRQIVEPVDGAQRSGARHVLHHHVGMAGDVAAEMAADQPRIDVVAAARPVADDQRHRLASVEVGDRVGRCRRRRQHRPGAWQSQRRQRASCPTPGHAVPLPAYCCGKDYAVQDIRAMTAEGCG